MANKKIEDNPGAQTPLTTAADKTTPTAEGKELYTDADFVQAAENLFPDKKNRPSKYIISAAFNFNGVTEIGKDEGINLIKAFMERKVA